MSDRGAHPQTQKIDLFAFYKKGFISSTYFQQKKKVKTSSMFHSIISMEQIFKVEEKIKLALAENLIVKLPSIIFGIKQFEPRHNSKIDFKMIDYHASIAKQTLAQRKAAEEFEKATQRLKAYENLL